MFSVGNFQQMFFFWGLIENLMKGFFKFLAWRQKHKKHVITGYSFRFLITTQLPEQVYIMEIPVGPPFKGKTETVNCEFNF
jgi:hypothetical protein